MHHNKSSLKDTLEGTVRAVEEKIEDVLYEKWHIRLHRRARHHIHQLRKRPDHHKDIISFCVAFVFTLFVFTGWYFISLPRIINSYKVSQKENTAMGDSSNLLYGFKDKIGNIGTAPTDEPGIEVE